MGSSSTTLARANGSGVRPGEVGSLVVCGVELDDTEGSVDVDADADAEEDGDPCSRPFFVGDSHVDDAVDAHA